MPEDHCGTPPLNVPTVSAGSAPQADGPAARESTQAKAAVPALDRRLAQGVFWSMAGTAVSRGLMLAAWIGVARLLGKTRYGEFGIIQSTVGMFGIFAGFGLGLTTTKYVAEFRSRDPARAGRIISLSWLVAVVTGGVMALGLFFFARWLATETLNAQQLSGTLRIGALILFLNALNGAQAGALAGFEAFKAMAGVNLCTGLISLPVMVLGAWLGGLAGAAWGLTIHLGASWFLNHLALRREVRRCGIRLSLGGCHRELAVLWQFSLPAVLSGAMVGPVTWACNALLVNRPGGYGEMGIFAAALLFQQVLLSAAHTLNAPLLSVVSNAGTDAPDELGIVNILSSWILGVMAAIPLLCFPELAQALLGVDYDPRRFTVTFSLVVFCTTVMTFKAGLARVLAARTLLWWGLGSNTLWALILLGCAVFFVRWGAPGLAASLAIAYTLNTVILVPLYTSRKLIPRRTLLSLESLGIWLILVVLVLGNMAEVAPGFRALLFVPCLVLTGIGFSRLKKAGFPAARAET